MILCWVVRSQVFILSWKELDWSRVIIGFLDVEEREHAYCSLKKGLWTVNSGTRRRLLRKLGPLLVCSASQNFLFKAYSFL